MSEPYDPYRLPPAGSPAQHGVDDRYGQRFPAGRSGPRLRSGGHTEPQPYHKLLLRPGYAWWRPLIGLGVFGVAFVALTVAVTIAIVAADTVRTGGTIDDSFDRFGSEMDPLFLLGTNLSLAVFIPAAVLAIVVAHRMRPGWLSSVVGRLRWGLLLRMTWLALAVVVAFTLLGGFIPGDGEGPAVDELEIVSLSTWLAFAAVIVLTTPLQAAAEEYAFRGYAFQALGAWFRTPWIGAIVTSLAFAFAHGMQNLPLFIDRFAFGLVACWLVVRTGGLEAAIALHIMNNVVIFLLTAAVDEVGDALMISEIPWTAVAIDVGQMIVFALLADRYVRRRGHQTRSLADG